MDVKATAKYLRMSPSKARDLVRKVSGKPVVEAMKIAQFSPRKAAGYLGKTLRSAIANAENNANLSVDELTVKEAVVLDGPSSRRFWPRARGGVSPVIKRTCHIRIVLTDGKEETN